MITTSYPITGGDFETAGLASRLLKEHLKKIGVDGAIMRRIMIAAYEAEMNVVVHACKGNLWVRLTDGRIDMEVVDKGPGIPDLDEAMRPGYSTASEQARELGFGAGMGLPNISKASDVFEIDSRPGSGTHIRSTIYLHNRESTQTTAHSLAIRAERCVGCLECIKACPARALRVRDSKPTIIDALCIDCACCIETCSHGVFGLSEPATAEDHRKLDDVIRDTLLIPRAFLTQFGLKIPPRLVISALRSLGFKDIRFSEDWQEETRRKTILHARGDVPHPQIAPLCPAVVNLLTSNFPSLLHLLAPFLSPVESAVEDLAVQSAAIVPACPGQYTQLLRAELSEGIRVLAPDHLTALVAPLVASSSEASGGEGQLHTRTARTSSDETHVLRAWGMSAVGDILEKTERGLLEHYLVLDLSACVNGCYGTPLFPEDSFIARSRWLRSGLGRVQPVKAAPRSVPYLPRAGVRLAEDMREAIAKLARIDEITAALPGRDCGACGAPSCAALAEDIVLGRGNRSQCVIQTGRDQ